MQTIQLDRAGLIDGLGRSKFSRHLWELILHIDASQGAVVGLEGTWGSGKTSVLKSQRLYAEELPLDSRPTLIEFKPWMLSGTSSLVDAMLMQFAAEVDLEITGGRQRNDLAKKILDYVEALRLIKYAAPLAEMFVPNMGIAVAGAAYAAGEAAEATKGLRGWFNKSNKPKPKPSLAESKKAVVDSLACWPNRIVMILDDIDRLPPSDVAAMIQAVKAVADFPNVVYVLAYDPTVVAHAIQSAVEVEDGLAYLEKIIQLPVRLPEIPQSKLNLHAKERLGQIIPTGELGVQDATDLEKVWTHVCPLFATPRDIERLRTRLQVALPILKGAVNIADVLLLESLDITFPAVVLWIERCAGLLMKAGIAQYNDDLMAKGLFFENLSFELSSEKRKEERETAMKSWRAEVNGTLQQHAVGGALSFLFDDIKDRWQAPVQRSQHHRVQAYRFWYQWRCYHDHNEPWTVPELEGFLKEPSKIIAAGLHRDKEAFSELMFQICDLRGQGPEKADSLAMVDVLAQVELELGLTVVDHYAHDFGAIPALEYCINVDGQRAKAVTRVIDKMSVWFSQALVMREFYRTEEDANSAERAELIQLGKRWMDEAESMLLREPWVVCEKEYSPYRLLESIAQLGAHKRAVHLAERFLREDPGRVELMFGDLRDSESYRSFGMKIQWKALPDAQRLLSLVRLSNVAENGFSILVKNIENQARLEDEQAANVLTAAAEK